MWCDYDVKAVIEREQAREQLDNMQRRFDENVVETQQRIVHECDAVRRDGQHMCQQLEDRVTAQCRIVIDDRWQHSVALSLDWVVDWVCNDSLTDE